MAVEIAHEAEQNTRDNRFQGEATQIFRRFFDVRGIVGEDHRHQVPPQVGKQTDDHTDGCADHHTRHHAAAGAILFSGTDILRNERCHRLHERRRKKQNERRQTVGNAIPGRCVQPQPVDKRAECQKRQVRQNLLQGNRPADLQNRQDLPVEADVLFFYGKGQFLFPDNKQRQNDADRLRKDGRKRGTRDVHVKHRDEQQVSDDVDDTRDADENQG